MPYINPTESLEKKKHDSYCEEGDIIFADASEDLNDVGKSIEIVSLNNEKLLSGLHTLLVRQKKSRLVIGFGGYLFKSSRIRAQIKREAQGVKVLGISAARISRINIAFPINKKEQQKIAACLTALDDLISAATGRLDALKQHKQGLMQQLFPAQGETVPRLRFPEFKEAGEYSTKLVEDYFKVGSSKRVLQKDWKDSGVPFYRTRELVSLSKNESFRSEIFISEDLFEGLSNKYGIPLKGDFLVSGVGTLGISYQVKDEDRFYFKDGNVIWFKTKSNIIPDYFNYCFQSQFVQNQILGRSSASTVGTYTIQNAKKTKFWMPYCKSEQQKIASCLTALDDLISAQTQKIAKLKTYKRGLMQQLFPAVDETN